MRVGIFLDAYKPYVSGVVTSVMMLEEGLKKLGHEVLIFSVNLNSKETKLVDNIVYFKGRKVPIKALKGFKLVFGKRKKINYIKMFNLDVIHIHNEFSVSKIGLKYAKKHKIPVIYTFHTLYEDYLRYFSPLLDKLFHKTLLRVFKTRVKPFTKYASYTILPTQKVEAHAYKYGIKKNTVVIPTGLDLDKFLKEDEEFIIKTKKDYNIEDKFIFLSLGRISEEKSLDKIVLAYKDICRNINSKLIFVGNGPYYKTLLALIKKYDIEDYVITTGEVSWNLVQKYYKLGDVMVNASVSETQGLTNIEAIASGIPLLVKNDECVKELVVDNVNGFLFDSIEDLKEKMMFCYNNKELLKNMKEDCIKSVDKFSNLEYARRVEKLYIDSLNK